MHYVDLYTHKVFKEDPQGYCRHYAGTFRDAKQLQNLLSEEIKSFKGFKNPKSYVAVIKCFEKETGEEILY